MISTLVPLFQGLVILIIVPFVILEEPLVGTTAFWLTRPISRGTLLRSKALYLMLVLALPPLVAQVLVMAVNEVTLQDIALAVPQILITELSFIFSMAALATISANYAKFALAAAIAFVAVMIINALGLFATLSLHPDYLTDPAKIHSITVTRRLMYDVFVILGAGGLIAYQYLTRQTRRSVGGIIVGTALALAVQFFKNGTGADYLTPEWLADATLVRLEVAPIGAFSRQISVEPFQLNARGGNGQGEFTTTPADLEALGKITLPPNPTTDQVRQYIRDIVNASRKQNVYTATDPQVAMLTKAGSENVGTLIAAKATAEGGAIQSYLLRAIEELATPENKAVILDALPEQQDLASVVVKFGWERDARATLIAGFNEHPQYLPESWIEAVGLLQDPTTYPLIEDYFVNGNSKSATFQVLEKIPGFNIAGGVDEMWKKAKYDRADQLIEACDIAAQYGHADALDAAAKILEDDHNRYYRKVARRIITTYTPSTGDDEALIGWVKANSGNLVFDPQTKKYSIKTNSNQP